MLIVVVGIILVYELTIGKQIAQFKERTNIMRSENQEQWKKQESLLYIYFFAFKCVHVELPKIFPNPLRERLVKNRVWNTFFNYYKYLSEHDPNAVESKFTEELIRNNVDLEQAMFYELTVDQM